MTAVLVAQVPALPARGERVVFDIASQTVADTTYPMTVTVTRFGDVQIVCGCPARKARCKHVGQLEDIYLNLGQATRTSYGSLETVEPALAAVPDDTDPFEGL